MNEAEKKLRERAAALPLDEWAACVGRSGEDRGSNTRARFHEALADFLRSEPSSPAVVEPEALRRVRDAWNALPKSPRGQDLAEWRHEHAFAMSPWYIAFRKALADLLESAPVEGGDVELLRVTLDSTRRQLDQTTELLKAQGITLAAAEKARDEAKREAEAMRDLATRNANELNAAVKERDEAISQRKHIAAENGELYRKIAALEAKLAAPLQPDEYTRAAVAYAEGLHDMRVDADEFRTIADTWKALYAARQRGEPSAPKPPPGSVNLPHVIPAPVSSQPTARVLECWVREYDDRSYVYGYASENDALSHSGIGIVRAHKVALPVIETVERGA